MDGLPSGFEHEVQAWIASVPPAMLFGAVVIAGLIAIWALRKQNEVLKAMLEAAKASVSSKPSAPESPLDAPRRDRRKHDRLSSSRVLLVEDDEVQTLVVQQMLDNALIRAQVRAQTSGRAALRDIEEFKPELIVLDLNLEKESGLDVLRRLRDERSSIPVLVYSSSEEELGRLYREELDRSCRIRVINRNAANAQEEFVNAVPTMFRRRSSDRASIAASNGAATGRRDRRTVGPDRRSRAARPLPPNVLHDRRDWRSAAA